MPNNADDGTPRSSQFSPLSPSASLSPTWRPPKSPLPPHRLAKLANALGVSTPVPANHLSRSYSDSASPVDHLRRSPTPSASSSFNSLPPGPSTSKFLLHVVPPIHLPHDSDSPDTLPPPNAPGYHTQFRRGTLVQVHSTLQAQLGAIAKEYALPSSTGLILYLVSSTPQAMFGAMDEPGPRLSEDIWKHLWTRVVRTEQRDDAMLASRSQTPVTPRSPFLLGMSPATRSTPFLPQEHAPGASANPAYLQPTSPSELPLAPQPSYPNAPSTPSSVSDQRSHTKSAPPSSITSASQSEPGTPDTSVEDGAAIRGASGDFLDLPGLTSPALIPILAKVEFDIDRRRAAWYDPWVRSRRANHAKRAESRSRKGSRNNQEEKEGEEGQKTDALHPPIELLTGKKDRPDPLAAFAGAEDKKDKDGYLQLGDGNGGYAPLSESPLEVTSDDDSDSDTEDVGEDATARVSAALTAKGTSDPLGDVFGTDADTWANIHAENDDLNKQEHQCDPNIVPLALTATEVSNLPEDLEDDARSTKEEDEVVEMLERMGKPQLAIAIPAPTQQSPPTRKIPPPLVLKPKEPSATASLVAPPTAALESTRLAYDSSDGSEPADIDDGEGYTTRVRGPQETDKRGGAVFDDLDLGLEPTEDFDDDDPNDRRRSQYLMSAQLDEIEKTLASLSPRFMTTDLGEEQNLSFNSANMSFSTPASANLSLSPGRSSDFLPPASPRLPQHPDPPEEEGMHFAGQSWPAVPFSSLKDRDAGGNANAPPSPPRLAVNGVTTSAPRSYMTTPKSSGTGPTESERRSKLQAEEEGLYPPPTPSLTSLDAPSESPVIPMSPDPFGRHPSTPEPPSSIQISGDQWDTMTIGKGGQAALQDVPPLPTVQGRARSLTTSRFSADSLKGDDEATLVGSIKSNNRTTLMSVKSIKNLWRKSNKSDKEKAANASNAPVATPAPALPRPPTPTATTSGRSSPMVPQRPERPSQDQLYLPDIPDMPLPPSLGRLSPNPPQEQMRPNSRSSLEQHSRPSLDQQNMPPPQSNGRLSPHLSSQDQLYPGRRPSLEQQYRGPVSPPLQSANTGRLSPQSSLAPQALTRAPSDLMHSGARTSLGQMYPPPPPPGHMNRPSSQQDQQLMPPPRQSLDQLSLPQQQFQQHQLSIPSYQGRNPNAGPIITPYMQASKSAQNLDRLHFDQESPYPSTRRAAPVRQSPRPPSPPALPAIPEQEKTARKSILRWKSAASSTSTSSNGSQSEAPSRTSFERPNAPANARGRRPSVINFGSTRTSVTSPELPPSPQIPTQYNAKNGGAGLDHRTSQRSRLTTSSTDSSHSPPQVHATLGAPSTSPPRSMASSRDSQGSRPSFDASQFEFVSPKTGGSLSYPYNSLDHQP